MQFNLLHTFLILTQFSIEPQFVYLIYSIRSANVFISFQPIISFTKSISTNPLAQKTCRAYAVWFGGESRLQMKMNFRAHFDSPKRARSKQASRPKPTHAGSSPRGLTTPAHPLLHRVASIHPSPSPHAPSFARARRRPQAPLDARVATLACTSTRRTPPSSTVDDTARAQSAQE